MLSDIGLNAILDNCPNLEHLDLRLCLNVNFVGDLEKRCSERIKVVRRPDDSTHDYPYDVFFYDANSFDDYYPEVDYPEDDDPYYPEDHYFPATFDHYGDDQYDIDIFGFIQI
uniref:F-box domain-containing protein n=2 Tax=Brassica oleracea var. oleracea TaxID=109376 RepID=A0A0D3E083_BRAOL